MARPNRTRSDVNLFPFLSVLCAMIGVLVLFLLVTVTTRVQSAAAESSERRALPPPPPPPERKVDAGAGLDAEEHQRIKRQIDELTARLLARQQEYNELRRLTIELAGLIDAKRDAIAPVGDGDEYTEGVVLEPKEDVEMVQQENIHVTKEPTFIEITAEAYQVHPDGLRAPVSQLKQQGSEFQLFLADFANRADRQYLILLLHPNATTSFAELHRYLKTRHPHLGMGWEPFSPGWLLISKERKPGTPKR